MASKLLLSLALLSFVALSTCGRKEDALFAEYGGLDTKADFYSEEYLNGQQYNWETTRGACKNLPKSWQKRALSVDTKGTCIKVFDAKDCAGAFKYVTPANGEQQLAKVDFAKKIVSVSGCFLGRGKSSDDDE